MKILVVEDDNSTAQFYAEVMRMAGFEAVFSPDAESAWPLSQESFFPIIILDWLLPNMDGLDLCRKIRQGIDGKSSYILVATVKSKPADLKKVLDAGADDYISKPLDLGLLKIRLEIARANAEKIAEKRRTEKPCGICGLKSCRPKN